MTWTAPEIARASKPSLADERTMLEGWLDFHRQTLLRKCVGLTAEQLKLRSADPSGLTLLGLVRHMAEVERYWFRRNLTGEEIGNLYRNEAIPHADLDDLENADAEADFATYAAEIDQARETAARYSLDDIILHPSNKKEVSLRWLYVHMIEEYARHNGHADILRERVDGSTGS